MSTTASWQEGRERIGPGKRASVKGRGGLWARVAKTLVLGRLERIEGGELVLVDRCQAGSEGGVRRHRFGEPACGLRAEIEVLDPGFYRSLVTGGGPGAGEAYIAGHWRSSDLVRVIRLLARNRQVLTELDSGAARLLAPLRRLAHRRRRNSLAGSRKNIAAHYDLGNEFYSLFLDRRTWTYSCVVFDPDQDLDTVEAEGPALADAAEAKFDLICRKLQLEPGDELLEIGTGWGGLAMHAAGRYGARVTTTTLSTEQRDLARERIRAAGLEDRIEVLLEDYRDLPKLGRKFDKGVSVEMIEAVGHEYLPEYFQVLSDMLDEDGMFLLQAITINDHEYERYRRGVDFIQRYIFPGAQLPSVARMMECVSRGTDLRLFHLDDLTPFYATTLRLWRERFFARLDQARALGCSEGFLRLWDYYLSYCEGAFAERAIGDVQMLLTKPGCRRAPLVARELAGAPAGAS